jgi:glucose/arabinose dehydrogenase
VKDLQRNAANRIGDRNENHRHGMCLLQDGLYRPGVDAFVALHGSWNRSLHTGYKIVRLPFKNGKATGEYQDFVVGFTAGEENVWGRPVDVTFAQDGSLLFSEDGNGTIYRVTYNAPTAGK